MLRAGEMVQKVMAPASKSDNPSLTPEAHVEGDNNRLPQVVLDPLPQAMGCICSHT